MLQLEHMLGHMQEQLVENMTVLVAECILVLGAERKLEPLRHKLELGALMEQGSSAGLFYLLICIVKQLTIIF